MSEQTRLEVLTLLERRPDIEAPQLCAYTRLAKSTCVQFLNGSRDFGPRVDAEFTRVLSLIEQGDILQAGLEPVTITEVQHAEQKRVKRARDFYLVDTVRRIVQVLNYCSDNAVIGVITGNYGVGKTEALQHWRTKDGRKVNHLVFEFNEFTSRNVIDFVNGLADRLEIRHDGSTRRGGQTMDAICAHLEAEPAFLVFDQCEACQPRILQVIRQIWDATRHAGVGVVMLASPLLAEKLHSARMKDIGALTSRVSIWAELRGVLKDEAANIVGQEGIKNIDDAAFDLLWRATAGSMRRLMAVCDLITRKHAGKPVTERTIQDISGQLWGLNMGVAGLRKVS